MNYRRVYDEFIRDRRAKGIARGDRHHIIPKFLGGTNEPDNLVTLTPEDHLFAHILLAKIHGGMMAVVASRMSGMKKYAGRRSRRRYASLRADHAKSVSEVQSSLWSNPDVRARRVASMNEPVARARKSKASKALWSKSEARTSQAEKMRAKWADPEFRSAQMARIRDPENARRIAEAHRRNWADPEFKSRMLGKLFTDEIRRVRSQTMKRQRSDPEFNSRNPRLTP